MKKNKPLKIELKFEVFDDEPLKKEILETFSKLMKLLEKTDDSKSNRSK